jgi:oxygen-independent coproporphyrinogen-3 oxidase
MRGLHRLSRAHAEAAPRCPRGDCPPSPITASGCRTFRRTGVRFPDVAPDLQTLRHSCGARLLRRILYTAIAGRQGYPLVFEAVHRADPLLSRGSPHLYVHVPFCQTICAYCPYNKIIFRPDSYARYRHALKREISAYLTLPDIPPVASLYFGGGTPSMTPELVRDVIAQVRPKMDDRAEIGIEVHPRDAHPETLALLRESGVNRISLGIESLSTATLRRLGRGYTADQAERAIREGLAAGFDCVDVNLLYGVPGQDPLDAVRAARRCIALGVDHLSAYPLITFRHTPRGRHAPATGSAYGARRRAHTQRAIADACLGSGFTRTSVWSFARTPAANYTTVTHESYRGFGAGAGSKIDGVFWFNTFSVPAYADLDEPHPAIMMTASDRFRRLHWLYWQVYRTAIDGAAYRALFDRGLMRDFGVAIALMRAAGWLRKEGDRWLLTERGATWAHRVQMLFSLTYIEDVWQQSQQEPWPERIVLY